MKTVLILGSGFTRAAYTGNSKRKSPPLDSNFFEIAKYFLPRQTDAILRYLQKLVGEYATPLTQSLEAASTHLYDKAANSKHNGKEHLAFLQLLAQSRIRTKAGLRHFDLQIRWKKKVEFGWHWLGWVFAFIAATVAIRGSIRFDVNDWLRERRKQQEENLRALCPHVHGTEEDGRLALVSAYVSPSGTCAWQCQICGHETYDERAIEREAEYWAKNPMELIKRRRKMEKLAKKLGRT